MSSRIGVNYERKQAVSFLENREIESELYGIAYANAQHRYPVINIDNKMITAVAIGRIIWISQIIKGTTDGTNNMA